MLTVLAIVAGMASTQITIFVIQPIGAVPEGRTVVMSRLRSMKFIDSADSFCQRTQGGVNLICRAAVMGAVGQNATIYARLPYSETLYLWSTGGTTYDR